MIETIAGDEESVSNLFFLEHESVEHQSIPEEVREKAALVEVGIRAGLQLAAADRVTVDARNVRVFWRDKAMLAIGACAAVMVYLLVSDDWPLWRILSIITLVAGIAGLVFRVGRDSTARAFAQMLQTSRKRG